MKDKMRESFEAWAVTEGYDLADYHDDTYYYKDTINAYAGFKAAYQANQSELARLRGLLQLIHNFLTDDKIGTYTYMEGSGFYEDATKVTNLIESELSKAGEI